MVVNATNGIGLWSTSSVNDGDSAVVEQDYYAMPIFGFILVAVIIPDETYKLDMLKYFITLSHE